MGLKRQKNGQKWIVKQERKFGQNWKIGQNWIFGQKFDFSNSVKI